MPEAINDCDGDHMVYGTHPEYYYDGLNAGQAYHYRICPRCKLCEGPECVKRQSMCEGWCK